MSADLPHSQLTAGRQSFLRPTLPPQPHHLYRSTLRYFGPRLGVTSLAWAASGFAFYGSKLFQSDFIGALYPTVSGLGAQGPNWLGPLAVGGFGPPSC